METKNIVVIIGLIILFISYIKFNEINYFSNNTNLNEVNVKNKNLKYVNSSYPFEHVIKINDDLLLCSGLKYPEIYISKEYLSNSIEEGSMFLYNIIRNELKPLKINKFPNDVPFHPHGISLYEINSEKYYLYVINHSIKSNPLNNEERIEKIFLKINNSNNKNLNISLEFKNSITLPQNFFGTLNSLAAINQNVIYFTTQNYFPLPSYSDNYNIINQLHKIKFIIYDWLNIFFLKLNLKKTYLYSLEWESDNKMKINKIPNSEGLSNHGLEYNSLNSILYMSRPLEKDIKIFEISRNAPSKAILINKIKTIYNIGNLYYDKEKEKLYAGIYGCYNELKNLENNFLKNRNFDEVTTFGGFEEFDVKSDYKISDIFLMKNEFKGISNGIKINNNIYLTSTYQNGILILQK